MVSVLHTYKLENGSIWVTQDGRPFKRDEILIVETDKGLNGNLAFFNDGYPDDGSDIRPAGENRPETLDQRPSVDHGGQTFWKLYSMTGQTYLQIEDFLSEHGIEASDGFAKHMATRRRRIEAALPMDGVTDKKAQRAQKKLEKRMAKQARLKQMPGGVDYDESRSDTELTAKRSRREKVMSEGATKRAIASTEQLELAQMVSDFGKAIITVEDGTALRGFMSAMEAKLGLDGFKAEISGTGTICKYVEAGRKRVHEGRKEFSDVHVVEAGRVWMTLKIDDTIWYVKSWSEAPSVAFISTPKTTA